MAPFLSVRVSLKASVPSALTLTADFSGSGMFSFMKQNTNSLVGGNV